MMLDGQTNFSRPSLVLSWLGLDGPKPGKNRMVAVG